MVVGGPPKPCREGSIPSLFAKTHTEKVCTFCGSEEHRVYDCPMQQEWVKQQQELRDRENKKKP
ncbi:Zinc finger, CCHC-type [uncultured Caudovirales phage]|uniref:Zinc finger, CCHC-type n=1 Tax=uncultured Caudovirales phage TaxID=2100421 RepID=A0A6J5LNH1_9CAUD|nr:Zinc finger, CCHC-type [uncultured Caudovirales phage]